MRVRGKATDRPTRARQSYDVDREGGESISVIAGPRNREP